MKLYYKIRWILLIIWAIFSILFMGVGIFRGDAAWYKYPLLCGILPVVVLAIIWAIEVNKFSGFSDAMDASLQYWVGNKRCGKCGKKVPPDSKAGQHCPHCGAYWSVERSQ